jgi:DNA repair exonuclease SbcCD nuclease subunit
MILFFSDLHMGIRSYSQQLSNGLFTAEEEARIALEYICKRAYSSDIDAVIFGGDWFHTNQPTAENIKDSIYWIKKFDSIGKPFFLIPGNHDSSMYSNGMSWINSLALANTHLITYSPFSYRWKDWDVKFVPYSYSKTMRDKEEDVYSAIENTISTSSDKTIIVGHIQEVTAKIGSESIMISKGVDIIDMDTIHIKNDIVLLLGHIHKHQVYKKGKATVCYPGNCFYHDLSDANQQKGFILFDENKEITFEAIPTIRKFITIHISKDMDLDTLISKRRLVSGTVVFISTDFERNVALEDTFKTKLTEKGCILGGVRWKITEEDMDQSLTPITSSDPYKILEEKIHAKEEWDNLFKKDVLEKGFTYLDKVKGAAS